MNELKVRHADLYMKIIDFIDPPYQYNNTVITMTILYNLSKGR